MIRKEIKADGTFGGNYPYGINYPNLPENLIEITEEQRCYIDGNIDKLRYINGGIVDISPSPEYLAQQTENREKAFKAAFISTSLGNFRKQPKSYANGVQGIDVIDRMVEKVGGLTSQIAANVIFYPTPDFTDVEQCTEAWLIANQYHPQPMSVAAWNYFYIEFQTLWAQEEYKAAVDG